MLCFHLLNVHFIGNDANVVSVVWNKNVLQKVDLFCLNAKYQYDLSGISPEKRCKIGMVFSLAQILPISSRHYAIMINYVNYYISCLFLCYALHRSLVQNLIQFRGDLERFDLFAIVLFVFWINFRIMESRSKWLTSFEKHTNQSIGI